MSLFSLYLALVYLTLYFHILPTHPKRPVVLCISWKKLWG
jgi:hypothetical protein